MVLWLIYNILRLYLNVKANYEYRPSKMKGKRAPPYLSRSRKRLARQIYFWISTRWHRIGGGTDLTRTSNISSCTLRFRKISTIDTNIDDFSTNRMRAPSFRRQAEGAKSTRKEMRFGDARRRRRRSCCREGRFAAARRPGRRRPSARLRMNSGGLSNNEEMSAVVLIRLEKPLKLIPGRRCWQTFSLPFIEGYRVQPVHLRLARQRYYCKQTGEFADYYVRRRSKANNVGAPDLCYRWFVDSLNIYSLFIDVKKRTNRFRTTLLVIAKPSAKVIRGFM